MINLKRILCPLDLSDYSLHALNYAISLVKQYSGELFLIYVLEDIIPPIDFGWVQTSIPEIEEGRTERAQKALEEVIKKFKSEKIKITPAVRRGKPFEQIIKFAREFEIDLIVIATHGRTGTKHVLFGSTTERVIRKSPCPVLSIRHPDHEFIMP